MYDFVEVPSDNEVIAALAGLDGSASIRELCARLMELNHPRLASQLAIQRAVERGRISLRDDWRLELNKDLVAA